MVEICLLKLHRGQTPNVYGVSLMHLYSSLKIFSKLDSAATLEVISREAIPVNMGLEASFSILGFVGEIVVIVIGAELLQVRGISSSIGVGVHIELVIAGNLVVGVICRVVVLGCV